MANYDVAISKNTGCWGEPHASWGAWLVADTSAAHPWAACKTHYLADRWFHIGGPAQTDNGWQGGRLVGTSCDFGWDGGVKEVVLPQVFYMNCPKQISHPPVTPGGSGGHPPPGPGGTHQTWFNGSGITLYVYSAIAPQGSVIDCNRQIRFATTLTNNGQWSYTVPPGQIGLFHFQTVQDNGCDLRNNKMEAITRWRLT
jgi:hypothetical protein